MELHTLASGDTEISEKKSPKNNENNIMNEVSEVTGDESKVHIQDSQDDVSSKTTEDNEAKLKERIAQCRSIIESLKFELNEEKAKLERDSKMSFNQRAKDETESPSLIQDGSSRYLMEDIENSSNLYGTSVDDKLNYDDNLMEYEKQLQKYQNTLNMAQMEKKNAIRKHMLAKAYKLKLLEVENQCNIELLRVKQNLQCLEPLQMIVNKWKTSNDEPTYDYNNFVLIPRYPELSANSGSDVNSVKDDNENENVGTDKHEIVFETGKVKNNKQASSDK